MDPRIVVAAATALEARRLVAALEGARVEHVGAWDAVAGGIGQVRVAVVVTGVGKTNTALALGALLGRSRPEILISVGIGGAYPGAGLRTGDLAVATAEIYGDEGARTCQGLRGLQSLGLPSWRSGGAAWYERLPVDPALAGALAEAARAVASCRTGPFVTVSAVTGTAREARRLRRRYRAVCESMEGAAVAHAALAFGVRFAEIRGVSNPVGPRDRRSWRIAEAADRAQAAVLRFLQGLGRLDVPEGSLAGR